MRLTALIVIMFYFFFLCSVAQAYYTVTPDKTFFVDDTTYCFSQTINVTSIGKDGSWFIVDDLRMMTIANASVIVRINSFDANMVNFTYSADTSCDIVFNCSGRLFTKVYLDGNETINVILPKKEQESQKIRINETINETTAVDTVTDTMMKLLPIIMLMAVVAVILSMVTRAF